MYFILWAILEILQFVGTIKKINRGSMFFLSLFFISLFLACLIRFFLTYSPRSFIGLRKINGSLTKNIRELKELATSIYQRKSYFMLLIFKWRNEADLEKARSIQAGSLFLEAKKDHDYVISIFKSVVERLGPHDEFIGVCDLEFWHHIDFGRSFYLAANIDAVKRGVKIRRLIVVNNSLLYNPDNIQERLRLFHMVILLNKWAQGHQNEFKQMEFNFFINDDSNGKNEYPKPFAYLSHQIGEDVDADYMTIALNMSKELKDYSVEMKFKAEGLQSGPFSGRTKYEEMFKQKEKVRTLEEMLNLLKSL
ncbi:MAG: hypothetical protein AAF696_07245 [Bacteroidota bacterium]